MNTHLEEAVSVQDQSVNAAPDEEAGSEAALAYEEGKEEITREIKPDAPPVNANTGYAVQVMLAVCRNAEAYEPALDRLTPFEVGAVKKLKRRAQALAWANALHAWTLVGPGTLDALVEELRDYRSVLSAEVRLMEARGVIPASAVQLQGGFGHRELADDVRAIGSVLHSQWETVGRHAASDHAYVKKALAAADRLSNALAQLAQVKESSKGTAVMRAAAWRLAYGSYLQVYRGMAFLRFDAGDVDTLVPSVFERSRKRSDAKGDAPDADPVTPVPVVDPVDAPTEPIFPVKPIGPAKPF